MDNTNNTPTPNTCDFCDAPGVNGTCEVDGQHMLVVSCADCALDLPDFTPFKSKA